MMVFLFAACTSNQTNPENWTDKEVDAWFDKQEWLNGWEVQPDASVDKRELAVYYHKNPERWNKAFRFMKSEDLKNLPAGVTEVDGKNLFVAISEYNSKEKPETRYESHKNYIDIQYVIDGEELIGVTTADKVKVDEPYDSEKDLAFYTFEGGDYRKATPENFMVFFPDDVHRPSLKSGESVPVKKAVVKIKID